MEDTLSEYHRIATQQSAKSIGGVDSSAGKQANAVRS